MKDIALDFDTFEPPPRVRSGHDDPAVIGVSIVAYHFVVNDETITDVNGSRPKSPRAQ